MKSLAPLFKNIYFYQGLILTLVIFFLLLPSSPLFPIQKKSIDFDHPPQPIVTGTQIPRLSTPYYVLLDATSNQILTSQNRDTRIYPASTTKLATALTALNIYPLDEVITIPLSYSEGKVMGLKPGEKVTVKTLVAALLIYSANDAAYNLAYHHPQSAAGFIDQMNLLIQKYDLKNTHFTNFDGLHDPNHYSTVYDLAQLGRLAIQNNTLRSLVRLPQIDLTDIYGQNQYHLVSTNELLGQTPEVEGLKTGWTPESQGSFIGLFNLNGHYLISVVAQSQDRFADTKLLLDWAKNNLTWRTYR